MTSQASVIEGLFLDAEPGEFLLEARQAAATVDQLLRAAGPGRVRLRVDVETHGVAGLAPGRAREELGAVGHDDLDGMITGVGLGLHGSRSSRRPRGAHADASRQVAAL